LDSSLRKQAEIAGGGSYVAHCRYDDAADAVARKLNAKFEEVMHGAAEAPEPSTAEMIALRDRYLEHMALDERSRSLWRRAQWSPHVEMANILFTGFYRTVVLAAALVILVRAAIGLISH
jgi:hypothetical protein